MKVKFTPSVSDFIHETVIRQCGFETYKKLLERLVLTDVSRDKEFQRMFTSFYRLRRSKDWLKKFYSLFQSLRDKRDLTFADTLHAVDEFSDGRVEISFSSKLYATLYPDKPIWDKYVRQNLGLGDINAHNPPSKEDAAIEAYTKLEERIELLLADKEVKKQLSLFDKEFPRYAQMTSMKKLDFILWGCNRVVVTDE